MNVQQSFVLSYEAQHFLFKRLGPSDSQLCGCSAATALGNLMEHTAADNSALVLDHVVFHSHRKNFRGFSMQVCSGLEGCCWV